MIALYPFSLLASVAPTRTAARCRFGGGFDLPGDLVRHRVAADWANGGLTPRQIRSRRFYPIDCRCDAALDISRRVRTAEMMKKTPAVVEAPPKCSCGQPIASNITSCLACGMPVGFPNVRFAERSSERDALNGRLKAASESAAARGAFETLQDFGRAVQHSLTVISRHQGDLQAMLQGEGGLMQAYHPAVRAGLRVPANNAFDPARETFDSAINPTFFQDLHFGALSLDGKGVPYYGDYAITLREDYTANRTTVFEENPASFRTKHPEVMLGELPLGYRAVWEERDLLAMAKLQPKIESGTPPEAFPTLLMEQQPKADGGSDFIECHVFGQIVPRTFKHVRAMVADEVVDRGIWARMAVKLDHFGVTHDEEIV